MDLDINIVIPMAGLGSRFADVGYKIPKPLIKIVDAPMIEWVVRNLRIKGTYTFIVQQSHIDQFDADRILKWIVPGCNIVPLNGITDGAARSILYTKHIIDNDKPLLIVNSDNLIEWNTESIMSSLMRPNIDGGMIVTHGTGNKWSYARTDIDGFVTEVAEKIQISTNATTGHYYWARGKDFVSSAEEMINKDIRYNNEFYIAPVYNQAIEKGMKFITEECNHFWSVGTPEDLNEFLHLCNFSKVK